MNKNLIIKIFKNTASIIVVVAMFIIVFYQNRDRDIFKFGHSEHDKILANNQNILSGFSSGDIKKTGDQVAFLSTTAYSIHTVDGSKKTVNIAFSQPILHTEDKYSACYELESTRVYVFKGDNEVYSITTDKKVFLAKVNKNGYLFVATEKDGYNCEILVYNHSGEPIFKWDVSRSEFIDGDINCENDAIILSLASSGTNELTGQLSLINITNAKIIKESSYNSSLFFTVNFNNNGTYVALGNSSLKYFNSDGTEKWSYDFGNKKLLKADVSNHDKMILAFSETEEIFDGNSTTLITFDKLGKKTGEKIFEGVPEDLSVGKSNIAIAIDKKIYLTNSKLEEKKTIITDYNIKKIELFTDDSHVFVLGSSSGEILK